MEQWCCSHKIGGKTYGILLYGNTEEQILKKYSNLYDHLTVDGVFIEEFPFYDYDETEDKKS